MSPWHWVAVALVVVVPFMAAGLVAWGFVSWAKRRKLRAAAKR